MKQGFARDTGLLESEAGVLLLVWPSAWDDDMALAALDAFGGEYVIYVGEGPQGVTATPAFFQRIGLDKDWARQTSVSSWLLL